MTNRAGISRLERDPACVDVDGRHEYKCCEELGVTGAQTASAIRDYLMMHV
jgi:hypothetical protein